MEHRSAEAEWRYSLTGMVLSWLLGFLGADRVFAGQVGLGVIKLFLFFGLFGVWWLIDALVWTARFGDASRALLTAKQAEET